MRVQIPSGFFHVTNLLTLIGGGKTNHFFGFFAGDFFMWFKTPKSGSWTTFSRFEPLFQKTVKFCRRQKVVQNRKMWFMNHVFKCQNFASKKVVHMCKKWFTNHFFDFEPLFLKMKFYLSEQKVVQNGKKWFMNHFFAIFAGDQKKWFKVVRIPPCLKGTFSKKSWISYVSCDFGASPF